MWDEMDAFGSEQHVVRGKKERVGTGLDRLDMLLEGGFPSNSVTLVSGTPGSGKTILCYHYIKAGLDNGEKCLYLTSDERIENIMHEANLFGFDFYSAVESGQLKFKYLDLDRSSFHREMDEEVKSGRYSRVVLDSLTPVAEAPVWVTSGGHEIIPAENATISTTYPIGSVPATRVHVRRIMSILNNENCTTLVTSEIPEGERCLSRDSISEFLVDGIILMDVDPTMDRRKLSVRKMRGTKHTLKPQNIEINETGIKFA